ncbi:MAG: DUF302 domain-containing protein [Candidatus Acidiferrum sp.]|jgi:uncharacterized protein (DUF302 family)
MGTPSMSVESGRGIEQAESLLGFDEAIEHFEKLLATRGMTVFAKIDFTSDAKKSGLEMPRMLLMVFGNPKGGTPVMVAAPSSALDLPLKVLFSQDAGGKVWLSYNTPEYLAGRHDIPAELVKNIAGIRGLVQDAVAGGAASS